MKFLLVPILLLLVLVQSFGKWIILAEFRANQAWIAAKLCENRNRPQLKCRGKCQLMKRMAEEQKSAGTAGKAKFLEVAWPQHRYEVALAQPLASRINHIDHPRSLFPQPHGSAVFRPPLA
ncbi:hypothetical protein EPD60_00455 [Flaviaesturariibacter flavus]|uniref:Uncharacterized protein n=1 Tax=Flaviaesturariibacter flavus TaxID=2502780 RepID=A0A4R1BQQ8_9BACT|nr:hypothetical protein [Flaviaesturariibacter flavus]TCJ19627.1 hypothetical protein EPD60_00455 [Flaviaesturariibacter flavus]